MSSPKVCHIHCEPMPDGTIRIYPPTYTDMESPECIKPPTQQPTVTQEKKEPQKKPKHKNSVFNVKPDWKGDVYIQAQSGASSIINYGEGKEEQSFSWFTDGSVGISITENKKDKAGFYFDANVGLKYDAHLGISPNTHRGGPTGDIAIGYKMPIYKDKTCIITWDNYAYGHASYCSDGSSQIDKYIDEQSKYHGGNYTMDLNIEVKNFDGKTTNYQNQDYVNKMSDPNSSENTLHTNPIKDGLPNLDKYELMTGVGTGFNFNIARDEEVVLYAGVEGGINKVGPEYTLTSVYNSNQTFWMDSQLQNIVRTEEKTFYQPGYKHEWYLTPKVKLIVNFDNENLNQLSFTADSHGIFANYRLGVNTFDINKHNKKHKKQVKH